MATVTLLMRTDMSALPTSGTPQLTASNPDYIELGFAGFDLLLLGLIDREPSGNTQGTVSQLFIDDTDSGTAPNIHIKGLSFAFDNTYFATYIAPGNARQFVSDLLAGNDTLIGSVSNDSLLGFGGNDTLIGRASGDVLNGGTGFDTASYASSSAAVTISLAGNPGSGGDAQGDTISQVEQLIGSNFSDVLGGGTLNSTIKGLGGNDTISGGGGNNILNGGTGKDNLQGGLGRDFFDFNSLAEAGKGAGRDTITDFNRQVDDRIDLRDIDAKSGVGGNQAFKFIGTQAFHDVKGELRCKNGVVQGDVNGDGKADFEIKVNVPTMVAGDFFL